MMAGIVLFDGACNFCNRSVRFILKRDPDGYFKFASLQGEAGRKLLNQHGQAQQGLNQQTSSLVLIEDEQCYVKSTAALRICRNIQGPWKILSILRIIPRPVRDYVYGIVAKNRYRWFGKNESCMLPSPEERGRFLD